MFTKKGKRRSLAGRRKATPSGPVDSKGSVEDMDVDKKESETAEQCLSHLCLSEHLSDISFVFKGSGDVKLPAHKCILGMRSPVFEAMFYGKLSEEGCTICIEDIEPETMKALLRFVYSDQPELNGENVLRCLYAAKKYALTGLVKQCSSFLENNIDPSNVSSIHEQAVFYEMRALQAKCFAYMLKNASQVFPSPGFLELSHSSLLSLLKDDELNMDEKDIFSAVLDWSKSTCKIKGQSPDAGNLRECLGDALFEIRFPIMAIQDFARAITPTGILTSEEQILLYEFNATNGSSPMGKFIQQQRFRNTEIIDVTNYKLAQPNNIVRGYVFKVTQQRNQSCGYNQYYGISESRVQLKVKSFTGTFVKNVKRITQGNVPIQRYNITANKLSFPVPVELSNGGTIEFHTNEIESKNSEMEQDEQKEEMDDLDPDVRSYSMNVQHQVSSDIFSIVQLPVGMETITIVK